MSHDFQPLTPKISANATRFNQLSAIHARIARHEVFICGWQDDNIHPAGRQSFGNPLNKVSDIGHRWLKSGTSLAGSQTNNATVSNRKSAKDVYRILTMENADEFYTQSGRPLGQNL